MSSHLKGSLLFADLDSLLLNTPSAASALVGFTTQTSSQNTDTESVAPSSEDCASDEEVAAAEAQAAQDQKDAEAAEQTAEDAAKDKAEAEADFADATTAADEAEKAADTAALAAKAASSAYDDAVIQATAARSAADALALKAAALKDPTLRAEADIIVAKAEATAAQLEQDVKTAKEDKDDALEEAEAASAAASDAQKEKDDKQNDLTQAQAQKDEADAAAAAAVATATKSKAVADALIPCSSITPTMLPTPTPVPNVAVVDEYMVGTPNRKWKAIYAEVGTILTSDIKDKHHIKDSELGLDFVLSLRPVSFKLRVEAQGKRHYGFVAQEVKPALKGRSFGGLLESDSGYGMIYTELIAPLVKAVQEQQKQIEDLKEQVRKLLG